VSYRQLARIIDHSCKARIWAWSKSATSRSDQEQAFMH